MSKKLILVAIAVVILSGCKSVSVRHTVELPVRVVETHHVHHSPHVVVPPRPLVVVPPLAHTPRHPPHAVPGPVVVINPPRPPASPGLRHQHQHGDEHHPRPVLRHSPPQVHKPMAPAGRPQSHTSREPAVPPQVQRAQPPSRAHKPAAGQRPALQGRDVPAHAKPAAAITPPPQAARNRDATPQQKSIQEQRGGPRS